MMVMSNRVIRPKPAFGAGGGTPAWTPSQGTFSNISLNTLASVLPVDWDAGEPGGPFKNWSGGIYASDFSTLGAYVVHGGGHGGAPTVKDWAGAWCFDLDTLLWAGRNVPANPLTEDTANYNAYGESILSATLGHTYPPHTYNGLIYQSTAHGGGTKGSLIRNFFAGSTYNNAVHQFDLSSTVNPPTRKVDAMQISTQTGSTYPMAAIDEGRGGYWVMNGGGFGPVRFVKFSDWSVSTAYSGVEYDGGANQTLVYCPPPYDCLVGFGKNGPTPLVYVSTFVGDVPQPMVHVTTSGTEPSDPRAGGNWSTLLQCIVAYESAGSFNVHKLTPPVGSLTAGTWVWSHETLAGVSGATPCRNATEDNGAWGRMIEVPSAKCFIWCDSVLGNVQAWRLTGMT